MKMNPIDRFLFWLHRKRCEDCKGWWESQKYRYQVPSNLTYHPYDDATRYLTWEEVTRDEQ